MFSHRKDSDIARAGAPDQVVHENDCGILLVIVDQM